jgi:hypothetical protein
VVDSGTDSCSDEVISQEMAYTYCLGVTNVQCGNVDDLIMDGSTTSKSVTASNILKSDKTMCYWGI